jgi:hypothetical protein
LWVSTLFGNSKNFFSKLAFGFFLFINGGALLGFCTFEKLFFIKILGLGLGSATT